MSEWCSNCCHTCFSDKSSTRDPKRRSIRIEILFNYLKSLICDGKSKIDTFYVIVEGDIDQKFWEKIRKTGNIIVKRISLPNEGDTLNNQSDISSNSSEKYIRTNKCAIESLFCTENQRFLPEAIKKNYFDQKFIIGMVDMDFQHPDECKKLKKDPDIKIQYDPIEFYPLFRTETRDLEILLCKLGGLYFFLSTNIGAKNIAATEEALQNLSSIPGFGRFLNSEQSSKISFKKLKKESNNWENPFWKFIRVNKNFEFDDIIDLLKMDMSNLSGKSGQKLFFAIYRSRYPKRKQIVSGDLWSICQGHDTMQILECMIRYESIKSGSYPYGSYISEKDLSEKILKAFVDNKCYSKSEMILEIINWEKKYHPSNFDSNQRGEIFIDSVYDEFNKQNSDQNNPGNKNAILAM